MRTVEIVLGGQSYTVSELPSRKNAEWRKKLEQPFAEVVTMIESAPSAQIDNAAALAGLVRSVSGLLLGSVDVVIWLLFEYSPELQKKRLTIEENAFDSEILEAFAKVVTLAFPFGMLKGMIGDLFGSGGRGKGTSTNSA